MFKILQIKILHVLLSNNIKLYYIKNIYSDFLCIK